MSNRGLPKERLKGDVRKRRMAARLWAETTPNIFKTKMAQKTLRRF